MGYKAIETEYKGYRFRSRLEARWAVCFDVLGLEWVYEHEGFDLDELGWYLPDFWFPLFKCYGEVKPKAFTEVEFRKCKALPDPCILFDVPRPSLKTSYYLASNNEESNFTGYCTDSTYWRILIVDSILRQRLWFQFGETICLTFQPAELAATSARFEFGERGPRRPRRTPQAYYGALPY